MNQRPLLFLLLVLPLSCKEADHCTEFETACITWCEGDEQSECLEEASSLQAAGVQTACYDAHMALSCEDYGDEESSDSGW